MTFSRRTSLSSTEENAVTRALGEARKSERFLDLTVSNPTTADLPYDADAIARALSNPSSLVYEPRPLGLASARAVVAGHVGVDAARIAITASTSEAYAVLFKLLCDPGDEVLVPAPSYPLLDWLASFESVTLRPYPLVYAGGWHVDLDALARARTDRTRAIVVVAPNNPTGSYLSTSELDAMLALDLPIISDEVFARYPLRDVTSRLTTLVRADRGLVFALSGLSKLAALPQMKLGWIACGGDGARIDEAMARLEIVLDAYLSVGAPVQHALPALLRASEATAEAIRRRTRANLAVARAAAATNPLVSQLDVEAGWYVTWRVPATMSDEDWALLLLREEGVYVHPGYFFDMDHGAHLVLSLLTPEPAFRAGVERIARRIG